MKRVRYWLIRLLAGDDGVTLNMTGGPIIAYREGLYRWCEPSMKYEAIFPRMGNGFGVGIGDSHDSRSAA